MNLRSLVRSYKGFADPVRLRLLGLLLARPGLSVGEIAGLLSLPQSTVSRQLAVLRACGLVQDTREGRYVRYSLGRSAALAESGLLQTLDAAALHCPELRRDLEKLKAKG